MSEARLRPRRPERARHPWIFAGEIAQLPDAPDGACVRVLDHRGRFFAVAYLNRRSKISLRVLSWRDEGVDAQFWHRRLQAAVGLRAPVPADGGRRIVNAEGDGVPGLIVDWYAGFVVIQISTLGIDTARADIVAALEDLLSPRGIYERSDVPERSLEGLAPQIGVLAGAPPPELVEIVEEPARLLVDVAHGQKTGLFLDQRLNRAAAARYAAGRRVLNCFAYSGGFGVHACLAGANEVVNVDISPEACELAQRNFEHNGCTNASFVEANAFDWLRQASDGDEIFGMVILDPPSFARGRGALEGALRGYKEINLRALKLLRPGGILVTCSCSRPVTRRLFGEVIADAAADARVELQLLEDRALPPDHPILMSAAETAYLKCLIVQVAVE